MRVRTRCYQITGVIGIVTATEEIWLDLSDRLRSYFRRRVENEDIAEDLLQEAFVRIHLGLESLHESERVAAWVFQIARNLVVDHYRWRDRLRPGLDVESIVDSRTLPESGNLNDWVAGWMPKMMERLPQPYRKAVELYELSHTPQKDIAKRLKISVSGAKSRVQRGRALLKKLLAECCAFERDRRGNVIGVKSRDGDDTCETDCCE